MDRALLGPVSATTSACTHRLADEGATLPTSQQDITLLALLSLSFERLYLTFLCIRCYILGLTQSINVWVQVISDGKSRFQLRSLNRGRLRETGNGVSISNLCSSIDLLQLMVSEQLHAAVLLQHVHDYITRDGSGRPHETEPSTKGSSPVAILRPMLCAHKDTRSWPWRPVCYQIN